MAVCLEYQQVYFDKKHLRVSTRVQILAALLLLSALAGKVWLKINTTEIGYRLAAERQKTIELDMKRRELELQLAVLKRPDMLSQAAKQRLGLAAVSPQQARRLVLTRD